MNKEFKEIIIERKPVIIKLKTIDGKTKKFNAVKLCRRKKK